MSFVRWGVFLWMNTAVWKCRSPARIADRGVRDVAKPSFQVLQLTMSALAQTKDSVKDVPGILGHSKADTRINVYVQRQANGRRYPSRPDGEAAVGQQCLKFCTGNGLGMSANDRIHGSGRLTQR